MWCPPGVERVLGALAAAHGDTDKCPSHALRTEWNGGGGWGDESGRRAPGLWSKKLPG